MDTSQLQTAIASQQTAQSALTALQTRLEEVDQELLTAKSEFNSAEANFRKLNSAVILGEAKPADATAAKKVFDDARDRKLALIDAAEELRTRIVAAREKVDAAERAAMDAVRPLATSMANKQLEHARDLADQFAVALGAWADLDAVACGGRVTGISMQRRHGMIGILASHGIHGVEGFRIGHPDGIGRLLTPAQILERAQKGKSAA